MKYSLLLLALSHLLAFPGVYAQESTPDIPATLEISGTVNATESACSVSLSQSNVNVTQDLKDVISQGDKNYSGGGANIHLYFTGGAECGDLAKEGRLIYHFSGNADNADGTVLANNDVSQTSAKGLGIGIFDQEHNIIALNKGTLAATAEGTSVFNIAMVKLNGQDVVPGTLQGALTIDIERL